MLCQAYLPGPRSPQQSYDVRGVPRWVAALLRLPGVRGHRLGVALSVAAWLIITPPWLGHEPDGGAPLARWEPESGRTFPTRRACEGYLQKRIADARNAALMTWCKGKDCNRCIDAAAFHKLQSTGN